MSELEENIPIEELQIRLNTLLEQIRNETVQIVDEQKKEIMNLLHELNKVKDATQIILGACANIDGITIKDMHLKYCLPMD